MSKKPDFDGNIHITPLDGYREHEESKDCWCEPTLEADHTDEGGKKVYVHRELQ